MCQMAGGLYRIGRACFARRWLVVVVWLGLLAAAPQVAAVIPPGKSHLVTRDGTTAIATVQYRVSASGLEDGTLDALSSIAGAAGSSTLSVQPGGQAFSSLSSGSGSSEVTGLL